ncbi:MAG: PEGA domain-containing protein [Ignavibacterium sp.]|nr:PEGA domain-containing protein [Ignavibacterium sp.]HCY75144.1 hypothetical protein [Ignavibacteriales bacterium]
MKKLILLLIIPVAFLLITSCDSNNDPVTPAATGNIFVSSNPAGAQIWLNGTNTLKTTADTLKNIDEGVQSITLKLQDYRDTTFSISVTGGQTSVVSNVTLVSNIVITLYGPVKIYETNGTGTNQPSGLDLSTGLAYGVSSAQNGLVDIYYSSAGFLVQSASLYPNLVRETDFYVSSGTNLFDGQDSPLRSTGTWTDNIGDRENNYVFLYDHDGNYSKLKIVNWGGGVIGEPAWVEVQWYYNRIILDNRF